MQFVFLGKHFLNLWIFSLIFWSYIFQFSSTSKNGRDFDNWSSPNKHNWIGYYEERDELFNLNCHETRHRKPHRGLVKIMMTSLARRYRCWDDNLPRGVTPLPQPGAWVFSLSWACCSMRHVWAGGGGDGHHDTRVPAPRRRQPDTAPGTQN